MAGKPRLYLDTSVLGALLDLRTPERTRASESLLARAAEYEGHVSDLVLTEIRAHGDADARGRLLDAAKPFALVPSSGTAIDEIVAEYLRWGALPGSAVVDARHVAIATAARIEAVVSWNMKHLVRLRTRRLVAAVNAALGWGVLDIVTPEEV